MSSNGSTRSHEGIIALLEKVCLLDPKAEKVLSPEDGDSRFQWFFLVCVLFVPAWTVAFQILSQKSLHSRVSY